jgi:hypothetical protein
MLYSRKETREYDNVAERIVNYARQTGFQNIKADFDGYESPASLSMVNSDISYTPDFTAVRGDKKHYFELVVKNTNEDDVQSLISKWKALEMIAGLKGGKLHLIIPNGSYKFASQVKKDHNLDVELTKLKDLPKVELEAELA